MPFIEVIPNHLRAYRNRFFATFGFISLLSVTTINCSPNLGVSPFKCNKTPNELACPNGYICEDSFCVKEGTAIKDGGAESDASDNCGNNICEADESCITCAEDCTCNTSCGDGICDATGETSTSCPTDCKAVCGNHVCEPSAGESASTCSTDCASGICGNSVCNINETSISCPTDCKGICGNNVCEAGENKNVCPTDCPTTVCGNGACESGETSTSCPGDCANVICGDGVCSPSESTATCSQDCPLTQCTSGQTQCQGTDSIRYCETGTWKISTCDALCKSNQKDFSDGCAYDSTKQKDQCVCGVNAKFGEICTEQTPCASNMTCVQIEGSSSAFCSKNCTSTSNCGGAPTGTKAECNLQLDTNKTVCGFTCNVTADCPKGLTCKVADNLCI